MADDSTNRRARAPLQARPVPGPRARAKGPSDCGCCGGSPVLALQQAAGNQAVSSHLEHGAAPASFAADEVRDEELERRADRDADAIVALAGGAGGGDDGSAAGIASAAERVLGRSMRGVRVHHDATARAATDAHEARAIAAGRDVYVAPDQWSPGTSAGGHLLAHELAHTAQQATSGVAAVQAQKRPGAKDDDEETDEDQDAAERKAPVVSCPGGAMPYNGVCLTDEVLEALPTSGDVHEAERMVEERAAEKRAQAAVEKRYAKLSDAALSKKIAEMRQSSEGSGSAPSLLRRLENERSRRRALPISDPTTVDQAIAMLEEAWSLAEKEDPPDVPRAKYLVHVVNRWLQKAAPPTRYDECFSGFSKTTARQTVGMAKGNVADLEAKFRLGASIGGWWPATINSLKVARELVQIMSGEKRIEDTEFNAISKTINKTSVATPLIGAGIMAAPVLIVAVPEIPALPATIGGVNTAVWGQTLFAATLSASYLSHVYTRSKEAVESGTSRNPFAIAAAAMVDAPGVGKVVESARNKSILTGNDLHLSKTEQAVGAITGTVDVILNFFGAKDLVAGTPMALEPRPSPETPPPTPRTPPPPAAPRAAELPAGSNVSDLPVASPSTARAATEAEVKLANETGAARPISSAPRKPPPPTRQAQAAVAQQPVQDVDVQGNLALKRETGGGPSGGATDAGGTSQLGEQGAKGKVSPGTGKTGTVRASKSGGGGSRDAGTPGDVGGPRRVPAPPERVGPGGKQIRQEYPPQAWHDIAEIEANNPQLRDARLRPVNRGAGQGKFTERMTTTGTSYSIQAEVPGTSKTIEFDALTERGLIVDNKDLKSIGQRWSEYEGSAPRGERAPPDVYEQITGTADARLGASRARFRAEIRNEVAEYGGQLQRQSDFIKAYKLPGGEWQVPDAGWKELLDAELKSRGITNIRIVVRE